MARKTIVICDKCEKEEDVESLVIPTGKEIDPLSNKYITKYRHIDLCIHCMKDAINRYFKTDNTTYTESNRFIEICKTTFIS